MSFSVECQTAPGFEAVHSVFERNFTEDVEVGASFCVRRGDEVLVDLWGGYHDREQSVPWEADSLVNVYSTTKGLASIAFAWAVEHSDLDYDAPVQRYWPELVAAQGGLTVGQLLSHQGGLCGVSEAISVADLYDWDKIVGLLEAQTPHWTPGEAAGYHAILWGYLPGELTRRVLGRTLGEILQAEIAGPLQADAYIGLPNSEEHRVATLIGPNHARIKPDLAALMGVKMPELYPIALQNPVVRPYQDASSSAWRQAEIAAANGQASARGVAAIYAMAANGGVARSKQHLAKRTLDALTQCEVGDAEDLVLGRPMRRGRGVILNTEAAYGPNESSYGHAGAGGSVGFADPDLGLGFGYVMNQMQYNLNEDTRAGRLIRSVYDCLS